MTAIPFDPRKPSRLEVMVTEPYKGGATISVGTSSTDADPPRDLSVPRITVTVSAEDVRRSPPVMVRRRALDGTAATPWAEVNEKVYFSCNKRFNQINIGGHFG